MVERKIMLNAGILIFLILLYFLVVCSFTFIYWDIFNNNTYNYRIEKAYNFNLFDYKTEPYVLGVDPPSGHNMYNYEIYANTIRFDNIEGLYALRDIARKEYANVSWPLLAENKELQKVIDEYSKKPLKKCNSSPQHYDYECEFYNRDILTPLNNAKSKVSLNNLPIRQIEMYIEQDLQTMGERTNAKRKEILGRNDFFYYSLLMSIGRDDPMIKGSSKGVRYVNTWEFIITGILLTLLVLALGWMFTNNNLDTNTSTLAKKQHKLRKKRKK